MAKPDFIASEVIPIIQRENGATIKSWEVCYLLNDELAAMDGAPLDPSVFYYGNLVVHSLNYFVASASFQNSGAIAGYNDTFAELKSRLFE
jgi:hypothetical protein